MQSGRIINGIFSFILILIWPLHAVADNTEAVRLVEDFHAVLLDVMKNSDKLNFQDRYDKLAPVIKAKFDTPLISQVIISRYWNELNEVKQQQFVDLFNRLSISTYASRFNSYSNESFITLGVEELKKGRLLIKTELQKPNENPVKFDYMVHQKDGNWYIISVIANGVNDVALKRAEYATIINDRGFDNLVSELETKISELSTTGDST